MENFNHDKSPDLDSNRLRYKIGMTTAQLWHQICQARLNTFLLIEPST
jgi:hypothetical protein